MPAAAAIPLITAGISGGTSILGGILGSRAANKSAQIQSQAAQQAGGGLQTTLNQWNPQIGAAAEQAAAGVTGAAGLGAEEARAAGTRAQELFSPYTAAGGEAAGTLRDFMAPGGAGMQTFTADQMEQYDPGYQFRLDRAKQALEKSAAARGGLLGGGTAKALAREQQNLASSEFGAASDRFRQQQQDRYDRLFGVSELGARSAGQAAGYGLDAARIAGTLGFQGAEAAGRFGTQGIQAQAGNAMDTQRMISDLMTGGAAARAAGTVGSANAWGGALGGVGQAAGQVGNYYQDKELLSQWMNPALKTPQTANVYNLPSTGSYRWGMPFQPGPYDDINT